MITAILKGPRRSIHRTIFTIISHDKYGHERKTYSLKESALIKSFLVVAGVWFAVSVGGDELDKWAKREKADSLKPRMEALANQGQDEASLWMMRHYWSSNQQRLAPLAAKGNPEAMLQQGIIQLRSGDKAGGMGWIEKAAAVGNADAILFIQREKKQ